MTKQQQQQQHIARVRTTCLAMICSEFAQIFSPSPPLASSARFTSYSMPARPKENVSWPYRQTRTASLCSPPVWLLMGTRSAICSGLELSTTASAATNDGPLACHLDRRRQEPGGRGGYPTGLSGAGDQPSAHGEYDAQEGDRARLIELACCVQYYFPPGDVQLSLLRTSTARRTLCEWKGWVRRWYARAVWTMADATCSLCQHGALP